MSKASLLLLVLVPVATACDSDSASRASAPEACARISACGVTDDLVRSFGECRYVLGVVGNVARDATSSDDRQAATTIDCLLAATTCDGIRACYHPTPDQLAVCDTTSEDVCSGNVMIDCSM